MKRGKKVFICHDGKWERRITGEVVSTNKSFSVKVKFLESGLFFESWAKKLRKNSLGKKKCFVGLAKSDDLSFMFCVYKYRKNEEIKRIDNAIVK